MEQDVTPRDMTVCLSLPSKCLGGLSCEKCCKVVFLPRITHWILATKGRIVIFCL